MGKSDDKLWDLVLSISKQYGVKPNRDIGLWWEELVTALPLDVVDAFVGAFEEMRNHSLCRGKAKETLETMLGILYRRLVRTSCQYLV